MAREYHPYTKALYVNGVNYYEPEHEIVESDFDPELTILKGLEHYWGFNDMFYLMINLVKYRLAPFINTERLIELEKTVWPLTVDQKILLIAISNRFMQSGAGEFSKVMRKYYSKGLKMKSPPESATSAGRLDYEEPESTLVDFGVKVMKFPFENRKILPLEGIMKRNPWIKYKVMFGPNFYSDMAYFKLEKGLKDLDQISKKIGASQKVLEEPFKKISKDTLLKDSISYSYI